MSSNDTVVRQERGPDSMACLFRSSNDSVVRQHGPECDNTKQNSTWFSLFGIGIITVHPETVASAFDTPTA